MVKRPVTQGLARAVHALEIAALVCTCACSSPETADVAVRVIDASTGRTTPAMVAIVSLALSFQRYRRADAEDFVPDDIDTLARDVADARERVRTDGNGRSR